VKKLWEKGYELNSVVEAFTVGNDVVLDQVLIPYDCRASIAHAGMLGKIGLLTADEVEKLTETLEKIIRLYEDGKFTIRPEQEDCHTAIENYLTEELGKLGMKIHTGRSRNDQVLTALRLFYKDQLDECDKRITALIKSISAFTEKEGATEFPGYTHMRRAMPSSIAMWGQSFIDSMEDNRKALNLALELVDQSPLGTGAGYGVPLDIDREYTAKELGFARVQENPVYTQNSRGKLEITILHALSQVMLDLNKIASDLILFSMPEFGYFELPNEFCTGSSIMPQKKNPDVLELLRARYHVIIALEAQLKTQVSNLISGYHRDVQLTKEPVMKGFEIAKAGLEVAELLFGHLVVNKGKCEAALTDDILATERVYALVKQGVPFREAYKRIAKEYK